MQPLSRRTVLGSAIGGLSVLIHQRIARAALQCAAIGLPQRLTVDCSAGPNLKIFLGNEDLYGLAGVVSMMPVTGDLGSYGYATMFLFPWLKRKLPSATLMTLRAYLPDNTTTTPLWAVGLPPEEQFCRYALRAPWQSFIGFTVDKPVAADKAKLPWYTNVDGIAGNVLGICWTSANMNHPWFAGSRWIPGNEDCNGVYWRARIVEGLRIAAGSAC